MDWLHPRQGHRVLLRARERGTPGGAAEPAALRRRAESRAALSQQRCGRCPLRRELRARDDASVRLLYTVEVAWQELEAPSGIEFENDYSLVDLGASLTTGIGPVSLRIAQEVLGSDTAEGAQQAFQTPYATKHIFNGWVDMFLNTPAGGIEDRFVTLAADVTAYAVKLAAALHDYAEDGGPIGGGSARDYGAEWNVQATKQFGAHYTAGVKYGSYDADDEVVALIGTTANVDTEKFWLWLELTF